MDAVQSSSAAFSKIPALPRLRRIQEPLRSAQYAHLIATLTQPPRCPLGAVYPSAPHAMALNRRAALATTAARQASKLRTD